MNNNRTMALVRQVRRWDTYGEAWVAEVPPPKDYACPVRVFVKRRWKEGKFQNCYYVTTLSLPSKGNFLTFYHKALSVSRFEGYGLKRIVRDLLATQSRLIFDQDRLQRIELLSQKQFSEDLRVCLLKYCSGFQT
jgi:hypothetical protein